MPCSLFTWHAYGTWMPDRPRGYVRRKKGITARDDAMATRYRDNQRQSTAHFDEKAQQVLVETARRAGDCLNATVHCVATDPTHLHILVSWDHHRLSKSMQKSIRSALSRALNTQIGKRTWFSAGESRKLVSDQAHFDFLVGSYLPSHRGACYVRTACSDET